MTKSDFGKYLEDMLSLLYNASDPCNTYKHHGIIHIKKGTNEVTDVFEIEERFCYWFNTLQDTIDWIQPGSYCIRFGLGDRHYITDERSRVKMEFDGSEYVLC